MSLPWYKTRGEVLDHPKLLDLCSILQEPLADAYVHRLWAYCSRFSPRGRLADGARTARDQLEAAVRWSGAKGALVSAMVSAGLVDEPEPGVLEIHDWWEEQSAHIQKAERDAQKKRAHRAAESKKRRDGGAEAARAGSADGAGKREKKTETEKKIQKEEDPPPPPASASTEDDVPAWLLNGGGGGDSPPEDFWTADSYWSAIQDEREKLGCVREARRPPGFLRWFESASRDHHDTLFNAFVKYLRDPTFRDRSWPTGLFIQEGVWAVRV